MGDFYKGPLEQQVDSIIRQGIWLHRKIDAYTDSHPLISGSKRRIDSRFGHYRGLLVDIFYDHFLACHWNRYSAVPLSRFTRAVYAILECHYGSLPTAMQRSVTHMINTDLLLSYRQLSGIERALAGIETRLRRPILLRSAVTELEQNYTELVLDFTYFFPQLCHYVQTLKPVAPAFATLTPPTAATRLDG